MSLLDPGAAMDDMEYVAPVLQRAPDKIPDDVARKRDRGRKQMRKDAVKRRICMEFSRGNTYGFERFDGSFGQKDLTGYAGRGKPDYRVRNKYDFISPIIDGKVSAACMRTPAYEALPTNTSPESVGGAKMAVKVAAYGYDKWRFAIAKEKVYRLALGGGGAGYALPYFDPNVGPYVTLEDGTVQGTGEIKIATYTGNQVYWEPGVAFNDSSWYAIEEAKPLDVVRDLDGFIPGTKLVADAISADYPDSTVESDNLVLVTQFFERPCRKWPNGRAMTFACDQPVVDARLIDMASEYWWGDYPVKDHEGTVVDEPLLHQLVYRQDGAKETDLGLTWLLIDFERTIQDCYNKIVEWKNRALNPQMLAPVGSIKTLRTDEPGQTTYFKPDPSGAKPEWETPVPAPQALYQLIEQAKNDMREVSGALDFNAAPNVAASTVQAVQAQQAAQNASLMLAVEDWDSRLMRHCILLVARFYKEPRLLQIRGRWDQPQRLSDFTGDDLMGETNIRVVPGSMQAKTRQEIRDELAFIQANWPGYLSPEVAIAALQNGTSEDLIQGTDLAMSRVNGVIQDIINNTLMERPKWPQQVLFNAPQLDPLTGQPAIDPMTGQPVTIPTPETVMVPNWMPTDNDNIQIWKRMFGDWMMTQEYADLPLEMQGMANIVWQAIEQKENQKVQQAQAAQQAQAVANGDANAALPGVKGVPSQSGVSGRPETPNPNPPTPGTA